MIISHSRKLIFWKPRKVAGTSVLQAMSEWCNGSRDVVLRPSALEGYPSLGRNTKGWHTPHVYPKQIRQVIPKNIWANYFKVTIIRNPWDIYVSNFWWRHKIRKVKGRLLHSMDHLVKLFARELPAMHEGPQRRMNEYYFDGQKPLADHYLRYENLEEDYRKLCKKFNTPYKKLPRMKAKYRRSSSPYWQYYDRATQAKVVKWHGQIIDYFGYRFGD